MSEKIKPNFILHRYDLPANVKFDGPVAVDTEAMGLQNKRDRLCVVQLSDGKGDVHLVHYPESRYDSPNLVRVLGDKGTSKLLHFARFDVAIVQQYLGVLMQPVYCTKTASRFARTYTDRHGLKDLCREVLGIELSKQQQSSDWGAPELSKEQIEYAGSDVLYLHQLKEKLDERLTREGRIELALATMAFIPSRAMIDLAGWPDEDIFAHM